MEAKKILFIGGKGGVGKSTTSAAMALKMATAGKKTLLVSTDPAHNIGHIFKMDLTSDKTKVMDKLYAIEINPTEETKKYMATVKENMRSIVQPTMIEEVNRQLDTASASPGADEAALFDKLISIMIEEREHFDHLIFDTAPTGHTIRLLSLPELMGVWIKGLLAKRHQTKENYAKLLHDGERIDDPIYEVLHARQKRFRQVRNIMLDSEQTDFMFVLNPEKLPIIETRNAIELLKKYDLTVSTIVVNRVLPDEDAGSFFKQRKRQESTFLKEIERIFQKEKLIYIPFFAHDMNAIEHLQVFASYLTKE
ncbi:MAG TPA: ArsA family ATPase [Pseudogracilibacillus sp.]|nr:ArsA family ATPase [Pseudogracilibacillus sp.]